MQSMTVTISHWGNMSAKQISYVSNSPSIRLTEDVVLYGFWVDPPPIDGAK